MGGKIASIQGMSYLLFFLSGKLAGSVALAAFSSATYRIAMMKTDKSIQEILVTPVDNFVLLCALVINSIGRTFAEFFLELFILAPIFGFGFTLRRLASLSFIFMIVNIVFSFLGAINGSKSIGYEQAGFVQVFFLGPLNSISGTLFSISESSPFLQSFSGINPMYYLTTASRTAFTHNFITWEFFAVTAFLLVPACLYIHTNLAKDLRHEIL